MGTSQGRRRARGRLATDGRAETRVASHQPRTGLPRWWMISCPAMRPAAKRTRWGNLREPSTWCCTSSAQLRSSNWVASNSGARGLSVTTLLGEAWSDALGDVAL